VKDDSRNQLIYLLYISWAYNTVSISFPIKP